MIAGAVDAQAAWLDDVLRKIDIGVVRITAADGEERRALVPQMPPAARR
jgi:hypothetical protein